MKKLRGRTSVAGIIDDPNFFPLEKIMPKFTCEKIYDYTEGLSAVFRQWRANSHCRYLHGYALRVELEIGCEKRDENGWVFDYGGFKQVKEWLKDVFDHKAIVAQSDPLLALFMEMQRQGLARLILVPEVGCENFAAFIAEYVERFLIEYEEANGERGLKLLRVTVKERDNNVAHWRA